MGFEQPETGFENLKVLCDAVRIFAEGKDYTECELLIFEAMKTYPHSPQPHNLIGIILEKQGNHMLAMKHFRAAAALDPAYLPARQNLTSFGTFFSSGGYAFDESDCPQQ